MSSSRATLELFSEHFDAVQPVIQSPGGSQHLGWASPTAGEFPEMLPGAPREEVLSAGSVLVNHQVEPSNEDLVAENARLKATIARLSQVEAAGPHKTPPRTVQSKRQPRKRTASRAADFGSSPTKRFCQATTPASGSISQGPIEAMWSPGVTPEERHAVFGGGVSFTTPNSTKMASSEYTSSPQGYVSSPAAQPETPSTPARKPAVKKARAPTKASAPKKSAKKQSYTAAGAPTFIQKQRPVSALYQENFLSLASSEKIRILLPLIQGLDPNTGKKWAEPGTLGLELMAAEQQESIHPSPPEAAVEQDASLPRHGGFDSWFDALRASAAQHSPEQSTPLSTIGIDFAMQPPNDQASILHETDISALIGLTEASTKGAHSSSHKATEVDQDAQKFGSDHQSPFDQSPDSNADNIQCEAGGFANEHSYADDKSTHGDDQTVSDETITIHATGDEIFTLGGAQSISDDTLIFDNAPIESGDMFTFGAAQTTSDVMFNLVNTASTTNDTFSFGIDQFSTADSFSFGTEHFTPADSSSYGGDQINIGNPFSTASDQFHAGDSNTFSTEAFNTGASFSMANNQFPTAESTTFGSNQFTSADSLDFFNAAFSNDLSSSDIPFSHKDYFSNGATDSPSTGFATDSTTREVTDMPESVDGATRQREALEKHARRVADGRRR